MTRSLPLRGRGAALALAAAALSTTWAGAQTIPTIPSGSATTEGRDVSFALTSPGYQLTQTIYESRQVFRSTLGYSRLLLRADGALGTVNQQVSRHLTIRMSGVGVPSPELADWTSFSANRGSDYATVLADRLVTFPAYSPGPSPAPFVVSIPLDRPFPTAQVAHLLVELETRADTGRLTPWYADAEHFVPTPWTVLTSIDGSGCPAGGIGFGAQFESFVGNAGQLVTTTSMMRQPGQPPSHPAVAIVGASRTHWGPFPLPLPLDLFGGPGCTLYTDPIHTFPGVTSGGSAERYTLVLRAPRDFGLLGARLHTQTMIADPTANALGLRVTPVATFEFSSPPDPYRALTLATTTPGGTPRVLPNHALILGVQ